MAYATGSQFSLGYVAESVFGTTPATPAMTLLRTTSCGLNLSRESLKSGELRSDRQIADFRSGNQSVSGDIGFEFSYAAFDDLLAGVFMNDWDEDVLKAGVAEKSFTFEKQFMDISQFHVFTGCVLGGMSLSVAPNAMVTGSFTVSGAGMGAKAGSLDASPTASAANHPFDSFTGTIKEGGAEIGIVTGLDIKLENGLNPAYVLGSATASAIVPGRSDVTGTLSAFFENGDLLNKFINETESSIQVVLSDGSNSYAIDLPRVKYTGGEVPVSGEGAVTLSMPFQALYDSTEQTNIKITR